MITVDREPIKHFPDYANPVTRRLHLDRFARAAQFLKLYAHRPVIGICVGAYDSYHIPDGEKHPDFEAPKLVKKYQTLLPYGPHVQTLFTQRLRENGLLPQSLGLKSFQDLTRPPSTPEEASSPLLWQQWILFRRYLVYEWLKDTLDVVKAGAGLPVTVTFDINFSLQEQFATPPTGWVNLVDFIILYYYGQGAPDMYIPSLLREVYRGFNDAGKPMICLHEFSSAYGITSGEAYARNSAPFVSGMMTTGPRSTPLMPGAHPHNQERVESFTRWVRQHLEGLADSIPPPTKLLILLDQDRPYVENPFSKTLASHDIHYDVIYVTPKTASIPADRYSYILIPADFPADLKSKIPSNKKIIVDSASWLSEIPSKAIINN
jgi:hypothetical protein